MAFTQPTALKSVIGISERETHLIIAFLQGAIHIWLKHRQRDWFTMHDLLGELDFSHRTPLCFLYEKQLQLGKSKRGAADAASADLDSLIKAALSQDPRQFEVAGSNSSSLYRWVEHECSAARSKGVVQLSAAGPNKPGRSIHPPAIPSQH